MVDCHSFGSGSGPGSLDSGLGHSFGWLWRTLGLRSFFGSWFQASGLGSWRRTLWWKSLLVLDSGSGSCSLFWFLVLGLRHLVLVAGGGLCGGSSSSGPGFWFWMATLHSGKALTVGYLGHEDSGTASKNEEFGGLARQFNFTLIW